METEVFKQYQKQLSKKQVDFLEERKKLCPTVILSDDLFDASIGDIPINITPPVLKANPPQIKQHRENKKIESKSLF